MVNPFKVRKPWAVFLVSVVLTPIVGMLYIGRARLAGLYLLLLFVLVTTFVLSYPAVLGSLRLADAAEIFEWPFRLIGAGHASYMAWKYKPLLPIARYGRWYAVLGIPVAYVAVILAVTRLFYMPYYLPSQSMLPNYAVNDKLIASRRAYDGREPARGDVIAFHANRNVTYIKRIVGLPRDRIAVRDGLVYINGKPVPRIQASGGDFIEKLPNGRSYLIRKDVRRAELFDNADEVIVPEGHYYVLGDNRDHSLDCRWKEFGFVAREDIVGPVILRIFDGSTRHFVFQVIR